MTMGKYEKFDKKLSGVIYVRTPGMNRDVREMMFYMRRAVYADHLR